jgi:NTE family protein
MTNNQKRIGLALSGGGFRAAAFHLGTLRKLHELAILSKLDVISSVSGGSIAGAYYSLNTNDFDAFEASFRKGLKKNMLLTCYVSMGCIGICLMALPFVLAWWGWGWLFLYLPLFLVFLRFQFDLLPFSRMIERRYNQVFFSNLKLKDLPEKPLLAINSTNVETGRPFTFSRDKINDSTYEFPEIGKKAIRFLHADFPVSRAVMASSCVPFAFTPVKIAKRYYCIKADYSRIDPTLIDGGVYDNQGIHKLTHAGSVYECDVVLVSDAGTGFKPLTKMNNTLMLLMQTSDLFMNRIKNMQYIQNVVLNNYLGHKDIAYFSLAYEPELCLVGFVDAARGGKLMVSLLEAHGLTQTMVDAMSKAELTAHMKARIDYDDLAKQFPDSPVRHKARSVGTNLSALTDDEIDSLMAVAACLTQLQVMLYCPELLRN